MACRLPVQGNWRRLLAGILFVALAIGITPHFNRSVEALSPDIVISQVYGGGGNASAPYKADYVELFNRGSSPASLNGWSVQYAASTGDSWSKSDLPNVTLQPGQYFLIQQSADGTNGVVLPTPDLVTSPPIAMSAGAGKVALVDNQTVLPVVMCPSAGIVDFVGYGGANCSEANSDAPALTNTTAAFRNDLGCTETDNNGADFTAAAPDPRNSAAAFNSCYPDTTIDTNPPDPSNSANASFAFSASEAGSTFECRLNAGTWEACASPKDYTGLADGSHTFDVRATNTKGNTDPTPATYTWLIDTLPPETTIDSNPPDPSSSADAAFTFSADETGSTFECQIDSGGWAACTSPENYTGLADGGHMFEVRATDSTGNVDATPATFSWTIDTVGPETTIDSSPSDPSSSADASFTFSADEAGSTFECQLDGGGWAACTSPNNYTGLAGGSHTFEVRATDPTGNVDATPATFSWTIDTVGPDTTIDSNPPDPSSSADASFTFSADEAGSTFECRLDGGGWAACTSPRNYTGLADGTHEFQVRATDPLGNVDATPATYGWTIDTAAPQTTIDSNPPNPSNSADAAFTFSANELGSTFECRLDGGGWAACTSPKGYTGLADGAHEFQVRATDPLGNLDPSPASYAWTIATVVAPTPILVSTMSAGSVGGLDFGADDILLWDGAAWSVWFDGSAANLTQTRAYHNITAFAVPDPNDDDVILAFAQNRRNVPGIVPSVEGMDLVRWNGAAFSFFFDGSDVALTVKTQEKIDGLHILPGSASPINGGNCLHYLLISTNGPGKVRDYLGVNRRFGGEDVLGFCMTNEGVNTAGLWHMVLDGSAEGMRPNSLINLSASADGQVLYLTTRASFAVDSASGDPSMVFRFDFATGEFSGPYFSAPATGIGPKIDGLQVMGGLP
jgi:hypothetical protein